MIQHSAFAVEPWAVRETELHLDVLAQTESVFALANGHIGLRGNLDEGEPFGLPGTYLNGVLRAAPAARTPRPATATPSPGRRSSTSPTARSSGCWSTTSRSTSATASCAATSACSTCAPACCDARVEWVSPAGRPVRVSSVRLVSFVQRAVAAIALRGRAGRRPDAGRRPVGAGGQRAAAGAERRSARRGGARVAAASAEQLSDRDGRAACSCTAPGERPADGGRHGPRRRRPGAAPRPSPRAPTTSARVSVTATLEPGQRLRLVKFAGLWLVEPALDRRRCATRSRRRWPRPATPAGTGCSREQRAYLDDFWERADVEIEGDAELQQAVRFALFHVLQAGARAEQRAIPAKGLTGPGYDGHTFWDTETFVLPVLTYTVPARRRATRCAGVTRHSDLARERARAARSARRRVPVAHDPRRGVLGLLAGRNRGVPHQRRHRRRRDPLLRRHRRRGLRARGRARAARRDRAAVALARPPRPPTGAFASTASPAPTSTARSPTTTSTRT